MFENFVFYSISVLILTFAILTILLKNIYYSLLSAMLVFILTSIIFYLLGSEYNAVIQFAIYGFAVPVIIALAVMFTGGENIKKSDNALEKKMVILLIGTIFTLSVVYLVLTSYAIVPESFNIISESSAGNSYNIPDLFSKSLYSKYVFAFEVFSLILTLVAAGLTIFKRGKNA